MALIGSPSCFAITVMILSGSRCRCAPCRGTPNTTIRCTSGSPAAARGCRPAGTPECARMKSQASRSPSCDFEWGGGPWTLGAQFDEAEQDLVPLCLQLLDRPRSNLGMDAVDELPLHVRRQHRRAEGLPPRRHWAGELLEEVLDAAGAA